MIGKQHAVEVRDITRRFGDFVAVDRVSFEVDQGQVFGFLGPNGAGKTTTIKMLAGLLLPSSGSGSVAGCDLATQSDEIQQRIGYMSQLFSLYTDLTVAENITFFGGLYGVREKRLRDRRDWVLEMAHLEDQRDRKVAELPLGWKQRLALGCAVLHEPPVLFLDEPTSGVDPLSRRDFWELIYTLTEGGTTIFVSTHYMEEAEYCHRLALMNRGRLIALDTPAALRASRKRPILEVHCSSPPRAAELLIATEGITRAGMFGRSVHATVSDVASGKRLISETLARGEIEVREIKEVIPSLEDVFIALIDEAGGAPVD